MEGGRKFRKGGGERGKEGRREGGNEGGKEWRRRRREKDTQRRTLGD